MFAVSAFTRRNFAHETSFCWLGFRGPDCKVIAEKCGGPRTLAGRTLGLRGPDLARGPEVARLCRLN